MLREAADGFCMALADSVPGVSGGTVAFIMGFYDQFIGSIHDIVFGRKNEKLRGVKYLLKLGVGWIIGMGLAVIALNAFFEKNIYMITSLFIGFIIGSIPVVCMDEADSIRQWKKGFLFLPAGAALVAGVTALASRNTEAFLNLADFTPVLAIELFLIGMLAISAMILPGISGSTILLVFGAYVPVMSALKELMNMNFAYLPPVLAYVLGLAAGAASIVRLIRLSLEKYRAQMIYLILGMMIGSIYSAAMGPTTLDVPRAALSLSTLNIPAFIAGAAIVIGMQAVRVYRMRQAGRNTEPAAR
ncbi:MAG: DUF368 domain-containing protein [Lachnospiraceae bacterium]|jgi:putative membrane protein